VQLRVSANGQKQTCGVREPMSDMGPQADVNVTHATFLASRPIAHCRRTSDGESPSAQILPPSMLEAERTGHQMVERHSGVDDCAHGRCA
jgi:hypothetical protein